MASVANTRFGQLVIGPPGSGKTTYVAAMAELLTSLGRKVAIVNLDPGNENMSYTAAVDVAELVQVEEVMDTMRLGPNGGLLYAVQFVRTNLEWLDTQLAAVDQGAYLMFDCPGQVELFTADSNMKEIIDHLTSQDLRLTCVNLVDSHHCSDAGKFVSVCLTSLTSMLQIALPHVNLLSKVDLVEKYGKLQFSLDYYTDVMDLEYLVDTFPEDNFTKKYKLLNEALTGLISDYSLVNFVPITVKKKERLLAASQVIDKANGYVFGSGEERSMRNLMGSAFGADFEWSKTGDIRTEYMDGEGAEEEDGSKVKMGNDLDNVDIDPQFQV